MHRRPNAASIYEMGSNVVAQGSSIAVARPRASAFLGSFLFGLPSDRSSTFAATAEVAERPGAAFAQFVMLDCR